MIPLVSFIFHRVSLTSWKVADGHRFHRTDSPTAPIMRMMAVASHRGSSVGATVDGGEKACRPALLTQSRWWDATGRPSTGII